jgi:hypothetical protein
MRRLAKQAEQGNLINDSRRSRVVKKEYNDNTYSLGDYADAIIRYGAIPSLSSQTVRLHPFIFYSS